MIDNKKTTGRTSMEGDDEEHEDTMSSSIPQLLTYETAQELVDYLDAGDVLECYLLTRQTYLHHTFGGGETTVTLDDDTVTTLSVPGHKIPIQTTALGLRYRPPPDGPKPPLTLTLEYGPNRQGRDNLHLSVPQVSTSSSNNWDGHEGGGRGQGEEEDYFDEDARVSWANEAQVYYTTVISDEHYLTANFMASLTGAVLSDLLSTASLYPTKHRRYQPWQVVRTAEPNEHNNEHPPPPQKLLLKSSSDYDFVQDLFQHLASVGVELSPVINPTVYRLQLSATSMEKHALTPHAYHKMSRFYEKLYTCLDSLATATVLTSPPTVAPTATPTTGEPVNTGEQKGTDKEINDDDTSSGSQPPSQDGNEEHDNLPDGTPRIRKRSLQVVSSPSERKLDDSAVDMESGKIDHPQSQPGNGQTPAEQPLPLQPSESFDIQGQEQEGQESHASLGQEQPVPGVELPNGNLDQPFEPSSAQLPEYSQQRQGDPAFDEMHVEPEHDEEMEAEVEEKNSMPEKQNDSSQSEELLQPPPSVSNGAENAMQNAGTVTKTSAANSEDVLQPEQNFEAVGSSQEGGDDQHEAPEGLGDPIVDGGTLEQMPDGFAGQVEGENSSGDGDAQETAGKLSDEGDGQQQEKKQEQPLDSVLPSLPPDHEQNTKGPGAATEFPSIDEVATAAPLVPITETPEPSAQPSGMPSVTPTAVATEPPPTPAPITHADAAAQAAAAAQQAADAADEANPEQAAEAAKQAADAAQKAATATANQQAVLRQEALLSGSGVTMAQAASLCLSDPLYGIAPPPERRRRRKEDLEELPSNSYDNATTTTIYLYWDSTYYYTVEVTAPYIQVVPVPASLPQPPAETAFPQGLVVDWFLAIVIIGFLIFAGLVILQHIFGQKCQLIPSLYRFQRWFFDPRNAARYDDDFVGRNWQHDDGHEESELFEDAESPKTAMMGKGGGHAYTYGQDSIPRSMGGIISSAGVFNQTELQHSGPSSRRRKKSVRSRAAGANASESEEGGNDPLGEQNACSLHIDDDGGDEKNQDDLGDVEMKTLKAVNDTNLDRNNNNQHRSKRPPGRSRSGNSGSGLSAGSPHDDKNADARSADSGHFLFRDPEMVDLPHLKSNSKVAVPVSLLLLEGTLSGNLSNHSSAGASAAAAGM